MADIFELDPTDHIQEVKFDDLVGEGKKYRDHDAVAHAIAEKDRFIERLKQEAEEARQAARERDEALRKRMNEEEFLTKLETLSRGKSPDTGNQPPSEGTQNAAVTPETIEQIIEQREAKKTREANLNTAVSKLKETFGDDYKRHVQKQAQSLNTTTAELTELASKTPAAFLRLMGVTDSGRQPDVFGAPPPRSQITVQPGNATSNVKNYEYYRKLRQEKGEGWYFSLPVQKEIWEQSKLLGDDFLPKQS